MILLLNDENTGEHTTDECATVRAVCVIRERLDDDTRAQKSEAANFFTASLVARCNFALKIARRQTPLFMGFWTHVLGRHFQCDEIWHWFAAERVEYSSTSSETVRDPIRLTILL